MPSPLARPRTNPLAMKPRSSGEDSSRGLSVQLCVQGKITSRTPKVAHTVTNSNARILRSQTCVRLAEFACSEGVEAP